MNIGIYPGSFDPITIGHVDIIKKALVICDKVYVIVSKNYSKNHMFSAKERSEITRVALNSIVVPKNKELYIVQYEGIISEFAKEVSANIMIRGIRNHVDLDYEQNIEQFTKETAGEIVTVYFSSEPEHIFTSSSLVRQFISTGNVNSIKKYVEAGSFNRIKNIVDNDSKFSTSFPNEKQIERV